MQHANLAGRYSLLLFSFLFTVFTNCYAQSAINGLVLNSSGQPLANANILLLQSRDSVLVRGLITDKDGQYSFTEIPAGSYVVSSSFSGYKSLYSPTFVVNDQKEVRMATLQFTESQKELSEVTVSAKKPLFEQKIDRMVVNVAASITSAGSTALEVLQRSPGILVDQQNNTLSMNGKNGVVIMINGKISRIPVSAVVQMLSGMPASNIEKIELITTPPANYDAEGNAGYINIVLKTNTQYGTNGSYSITAGYGGGGWVSSANTNFNHRKGRVNIYGDLSLSRTELSQYITFNRSITNPGKNVETHILTNRDPIITNIDGRLGLDYELDKKTVIGALFTGYNNRWAMTADNNSQIFLNGTLDTTITMHIDEKHPLFNYAANINVQHNFSGNEKLTVNVDYVYYKDRNPVKYQNAYFNGDGIFLNNEAIQSNKTTPIEFWTTSIDYSKKFGKNIDMEAGVKGTISRFVNDVEVERQQSGDWIKDPELTARYKLNERIGAAYTSFTIALDQKTTAKLGLRYEYTNSNLGAENIKNIVDRQYGNLFPSLFISRKFNENNSANISYNRRITRPTFNDMAPFVIFMDPNTFFSGNPALQPSIANAVKVDYIIKKLIFSVSYTHDNHTITRFFPRVDSVTNKQTMAAQNQRSQKIVSLNMSLPLQLTKWWNIQNNIAGLWTEMNAFYLGNPVQARLKSFNLSSAHTFSLPKDYSIELTGFYQSGGLFGIARIQGFLITNFGVQKKLSPKHGTLRFNISNLTGPPTFKATVKLPEQNLQMNNTLRFVNTVVRLTYTKTFGNQKVKEKRNRTTSSEQERQRVNTSN